MGSISSRPPNSAGRHMKLLDWERLLCLMGQIPEWRLACCQSRSLQLCIDPRPSECRQEELGLLTRCQINRPPSVISTPGGGWTKRTAVAPQRSICTFLLTSSLKGSPVEFLTSGRAPVHFQFWMWATPELKRLSECFMRKEMLSTPDAKPQCWKQPQGQNLSVCQWECKLVCLQEKSTGLHFFYIFNLFFNQNSKKTRERDPGIKRRCAGGSFSFSCRFQQKKTLKIVHGQDFLHI